MPSDIGQRFLDFILTVAKNESDFAKKIGLNRTDSIYKITKHGSDPGSVTINRVISAFPELNVNWLMTGEGAMFSSQDANNYIEKRRKLKTANNKEETIPAFDRVVAQQGPMTESLIPTTQTDKAGLVKKEMFRNAQFVIRSSGNSMIPNYPPDAWIGIRRVDDISPGSVYA